MDTPHVSDDDVKIETIVGKSCCLILYLGECTIVIHPSIFLICIPPVNEIVGLIEIVPLELMHHCCITLGAGSNSASVVRAGSY